MWLIKLFGGRVKQWVKREKERERNRYDTLLDKQRKQDERLRKKLGQKIVKRVRRKAEERIQNLKKVHDEETGKLTKTINELNDVIKSQKQAYREYRDDAAKIDQISYALVEGVRQIHQVSLQLNHLFERVNWDAEYLNIKADRKDKRMLHLLDGGRK